MTLASTPAARAALIQAATTYAMGRLPHDPLASYEPVRAVVRALADRGWLVDPAAPPAPAPAPTTERARWQALADALNALPLASIESDGTLTDRRAWSVVWDCKAECWVVAGYGDDDAEVPAPPAPTGPPCPDSALAELVARMARWAPVHWPPTVIL